MLEHESRKLAFDLSRIFSVLWAQILLIDWLQVSAQSAWESIGLDFRYPLRKQALFPERLNRFPTSLVSLSFLLEAHLAMDRPPALLSCSSPQLWCYSCFCF